MGDDTEPANLMMILSFVILPFLFFKKNNVPFYERLASFIRHFFLEDFPCSDTVMLSPYTCMHLEHKKEIRERNRLKEK